MLYARRYAIYARCIRHVFSQSQSCYADARLLLRAQGLVSTGTSYYHSASGLTVRQLSVSADGGSATVTVCRNSTAVETGALCFNGLDDDCDGLADADDPELCSGAAAAAAGVDGQQQ